ncbi:MAG: glycosyltransferase family 2 protein [Candidatus Bathyarchaeota archaeon]|nr:glycosyltransferase family 2 protein [Candidatus Bathyarchaeota archaeon]
MVNKKSAAAPFEPLISVVIPTYNRAHVLPRAINSVLSQSYPNFELIVVDDCSTDSTKAVIDSFDDERLRYIRHEKNQGAVCARNTGIKAAKGEYIAFQDSDDEWLPEKLRVQVSAFACVSLEVGVVYTSFWSICGGDQMVCYPCLDEVKQTEGDVHCSMLRKNFVGTPTALVRKECFDVVGLFEDLPCLQEWALWLKLSQRYHFKYVKEPLVNAYAQPDSISRKTASLITARKYLLNKYYDEISKTPKLLSRHFFEIGTYLCLNGEINEGKNYFFKAVKAYPFDSKLLFSTFFSLFGQKIYNNVAGVYLQSKSLAQT